MTRSDATGALPTMGRRRRIGGGLAAVAIVVLVATGLLGLERAVAAADDEDASTHHALALPTRIERPYFTRNLPARPGALAGVLWSKGTWFAVSPAGHLWKLPLATDPDHTPALSPDGSMLAFFQEFPDGKHTRLLVWNTVTGLRRFYSAIGSGELKDGQPVDKATRYYIAPQAPMYFSPDGTRIIVGGERFPTAGADDRALLLRPAHDADVTVLGSPTGTSEAFPAGWLDDDPVWVDVARSKAVVTTLTGEATRTISLALPNRRAAYRSQWVGPVSPDGRGVLVGAADGWIGTSPVLSIWLDRDPSTYAAIDTPATPATICPLGWTSSDEPVVPQAAADLIDGPPSVIADPRLHVDCSIWAADALAGPHHRGLTGIVFGQRSAWWTWWWRELIAGLVASVGLAT